MSEGVARVRSSPSFTFRRRSQNGLMRRWDDLSPKLQREVLSYLDYHNLLKCRLVSKNMKSNVEKVVELKKLNPNFTWNPYFSSFPSQGHVEGKQILGLVRFHGTTEMQQFFKQYNTSGEPVTAPIESAHSSNKTSTPSAPPSVPPQPSPSKALPCNKVCAVAKIQVQQSATAAKAPSPKRNDSAFSFAKQTQSSTNKIVPPVRKAHSFTSSESPIRPKTGSTSGPAAKAAIHSSFHRECLVDHSQRPTPKSPVISSVPHAAPIKPTAKNQLAKASTLSSSSSKQTTQTKAPSVLKTANKVPATAPTLPPKLIDPVNLTFVFPLDSVFIQHELQHANGNDNEKSHNSEDDSPQNFLRLTKRLVQDYGKHLTSFTFNDAKGERSTLTFEHLHSILSHLPLLIFLSITSENYEHHLDYEELLNSEEQAEKLPPLTHLEIVSLGYNPSYHLHMDILNAYGCQLKRFTCSMFGHFIRSHFGYYVSTNNSLLKLLEYANSSRVVDPSMLSSLEELKVPVLSSQCLMREVEQAAVGSRPMIEWSNLKRLSLYYIHRGDGYNDCCLADLLSILNTFSSTLEEFHLDFQGCTDFIEWLSADQRPLSQSVLQPCRNVRRFYVSAISLLRSQDMAKMIGSKFPNLTELTFFNWTKYFNESVVQNNRQGRYYSGGPTPVTLPGHIGHFWRELGTVQKVSIMMDTWIDDCIYQKSREEMHFVSKNEITYVF